MKSQEKNDNQRPEEEDLTAYESLFNSLRDEYVLILNWVKPKPEANQILEYLKLIYKLPVLILVTLLSPVAFLILAFVFFATL
jgi:hypothetical protein